ncbi:Hsp20/alpha crystallin family protein [Candidatus Parcubacteria bacterium]|nr:Hsp20/alpha crystallin family protein [Candidatus Parcubacteria bacterium]
MTTKKDISNGVKKHKFQETKKTDRAREELKGLEDLPLVGGLVRGLEKFVDLVERVEEAGGELRKQGEIKGLGEKTKGIYGFSIRTGIGERPKIQTFGNIKTVREKERVKPKFEVTETREPIIDVFDEKDHVLIVAELPVINEKVIETNLKGDILILEAGEQGKRKYYKEILLPTKVNAETKEMTYKNGILEIKFKKA